MRAVLIVLSILLAAAGVVLLVVKPWGGGAELVYALSLPPDLSPRPAAEETARVLERRARALGLDAAALAAPDGRVRLRLAGLKPEDVEPLREAFERKGRLELLAAADKETQERYNADGKLPPGFRVGKSEGLPGASEYAAWSKGAVLLAEPPVVRTADVSRADSVGHVGLGGSQWAVSIELQPQAAEAFDALAVRLYHARPPGLVAIVIDGRVVSLPAIRAETFLPNLEIAGAKDEKEARAWAAMWAGGELPCLLRPPEVGGYRGRMR